MSVESPKSKQAEDRLPEELEHFNISCTDIHMI